jgi:hypothetical protein
MAPGAFVEIDNRVLGRIGAGDGADFLHDRVAFRAKHGFRLSQT